MTVVERLIEAKSKERPEVFLSRCKAAGMSNRQIARLVGTTHVSIARLLNRMNIDQVGGQSA